MTDDVTQTPAEPVESLTRPAPRPSEPAGSPGHGRGHDEDVGTRQAGAADEAWRAAEQALKKVKSELVAGRSGNAQKAALTFAILVDKSDVLSTRAVAQREASLRLAQREAALMVEAIEGVLKDLGVTSHPDARAVVRHHLALAAGEPSLAPAPSPLSAAIAEFVRLGGRLPAALPELPAGEPPADPSTKEVEVKPRKSLRDKLKRKPEVVSGEVVVEGARWAPTPEGELESTPGFADLSPHEKGEARAAWPSLSPDQRREVALQWHPELWQR